MFLHARNPFRESPSTARWWSAHVTSLPAGNEGNDFPLSNPCSTKFKVRTAPLPPSRQSRFGASTPAKPGIERENTACSKGRGGGTSCLGGRRGGQPVFLRIEDHGQKVTGHRASLLPSRPFFYFFSFFAEGPSLPQGGRGGSQAYKRNNAPLDHLLLELF